MKISEKLKNYIVRIVKDETEELKNETGELRNRENLLEENVRNLNAVVAIEGQETIAENVQNLNRMLAGYDALNENVRNLNASIEVQNQVVQNIQNLNRMLAGYEELAENVRNLNIAMEGREELIENVQNLNKMLVGYEALTKNVQNLNVAMEGREELIENVRNLNAAMEDREELIENVQNLNKMLAGYEALTENVRNLNAAMESREQLTENVRNLNAAMEGREELIENVQNLNKMLAGYEALTENVRNLNTMLRDYADVRANSQKNNSILEKLDSEIEMQKVKLTMLEKTRNRQLSYLKTPEADVTKMEPMYSAPVENVYSGIDYFDFENHFRGSMQRIRETQELYVKYFNGRKNVVDLGCGRGEFLELLRENNVDAQGVDLYEEFVEMCNNKNLKVTQGDAIEFLKKQEKVGGIFAAQLIEHISTRQLVTLCEVAYDKLEDGAYIILETPNPQSLSIFTNSFYIDPSHNKPIHPFTAQYILQKAGFKEIEIIYTSSSKPQISIPPIEQENMDGFNDAMQKVEDMLFGSQDYAIIAKR